MSISTTTSPAADHRTPLSTEGLKKTMTAARDDLRQVIGAVDPVLGDEQRLLAEAIEAARVVYLAESDRLTRTAPGLGSDLLITGLADTSSVVSMNDLQAAVERADLRIRAAAEIEESMAGDHWETHKEIELAKGVTKEDYLADRHRRARIRAASVWSQAASMLMRLLARRSELAGTSGGVAAELAVRTAKTQGRDHNGRVFCFLMSTDTGDVLRQTGVDASDSGTRRAQGAGSFTDKLVDLFSSAACHKDARDITDMLSSENHSGTQQITVTSLNELPRVLTTIMAAVTGCDALVKLLKLSVYDNHSMVFIIGPAGATRLETVAARDSKTIMVNDLIQHTVEQQDPGAAVRAGLLQLCKSDKAVQLEFEVHRATSQETADERIHDKLRAGLTRLGLGMAIGSREMTATYPAVQTITRRTALRIPERGARDGGIAFYELATPAAVTVPQPGAEYRVRVEGSWLRVRVDAITGEGRPAWMYPMVELTVQNVNSNLENPVRPPSREVTMALAHLNGTYKNVKVTHLKTRDLTGMVFTNHNDEQWIVTGDSSPGGTLTRNVTLRRYEQ